jgi:REP element-mobilizing transposase RayT
VARILRSTLPDGYFHVSARGVYGAHVFRSSSDRRLFLRLLRSCETRHRWICHAFCLMTTHYHLVIETEHAALSAGMQRLNSRYAAAFNLRHGRFGHVFAERFSARAIDDEAYLHDACSYVVLNPVKAGLCDRVEDWPWSYSRFGLDAS